MRLVILVALLALGACGKDDSGTSDAPVDNRAMLVTNAAAMPACDEESQDRIVYVQSESKLKACNAGAWGDVSVASTPAAPVSLIEKSWVCGAGDDLDPSASINKSVATVQVAKLTSGDYFMSCTGILIFPDTEDAVTPAQALIFKSSDKEVTDGVLVCPLQFVSAEFTIATGKARYIDAANNSRDQEVKCDD